MTPSNIYLIDADALIHAYRHDFPPAGNHSGFWDWLDNIGQKFKIVVPEAVHDELAKGNDGLSKFIHSLPHVGNEPTNNCLPYMPNVLSAYGVSTEIDIEIISKKADAYLIAHAIGLNATVVTNEISEPAVVAPRNKKIPDICNILHVPCVRYPHFIWEMHVN